LQVITTTKLQASKSFDLLLAASLERFTKGDAKPFPPKCTAFGPGLTSATYGKISEFVIQANDVDGFPIKKGGHDFQVKIVGEDSPLAE
jgi:hypothetical protein